MYRYPTGPTARFKSQVGLKLSRRHRYDLGLSAEELQQLGVLGERRLSGCLQPSFPSAKGDERPGAPVEVAHCNTIKSDQIRQTRICSPCPLPVVPSTMFSFIPCGNHLNFANLL